MRCKLNRYSVTQLNRLSRNNEIWCFGCGKRFNEMLAIYEDEIFVKKISTIIDNNSSLWGIKKKIFNHECEISGFQQINSCHDKRIILIITSDRYNEIYASIADKIKNGNISVTIYPVYYYSYTKTIMNLCSCIPAKRQILFYAGKEPHDNADEIVRYLNQEYQGKKFSIVYLDEASGTDLQKVKHINKFTLRKKNKIQDVIGYCLAYGRSRYLCYENETLEKVRDNQVLFYLNHGTIPLKDVSDVLKQSIAVDYGTCPGEGCAEIYANQYGIDVNKQIYMMPARVNKMLCCEKKECGQQVIVWLPTFRSLEGSDRRDSLEANPLVGILDYYESLNDFLKLNNQILIIKKHPREKNNLDVPLTCGNIKIIDDRQLEEKGITLQELLKNVDALLTDYSGIAFEYMLLNRPIGYVIFDMDKYVRGFSVKNPYDYMPGMHIKNIDGLKEFLTNLKLGDDEYYKKRLQLVNQLFGEHAYENGAEKLINFIDSLESK